MTKNEIMTYVAAILTTALETEPDFFPETMAYLAIGGDMGKWETVRNIMLGAKMITLNSNVIRLTANGRDLAQQCNAALVKA